MAGFSKLADIVSGPKNIAGFNFGDAFYLMYIDKNANRLRANYDGGTLLGPMLANAGEWISWVFTCWAIDDWRFFVNGGNKQTSNSPGFPNPAYNRFYVGGPAGTQGIKHAWNLIYTRGWTDQEAADFHTGVIPVDGRLHAFPWDVDPGGVDLLRFDRDNRLEISLNAGATIDVADNPALVFGPPAAPAGNLRGVFASSPRIRTS
jgi:hypothetical protein